MLAERVSPMCPCCGYNLRAERRLVAGRFTYRPGEGFHVDGQRLEAPPQVHELLGSIMLASGRTVSREVLRDRLGSEAERPNGVTSVLLHRARRLFSELDVPCPIETVWTQGLRWRGPAVLAGE